LPDSSGEKLCPICDSPLQPGSKKCSFCGTDLTIFDIEVEAPKKAPEPSKYTSRSQIDSRVNEVLSRPQVREAPSPIREAPRPSPPIQSQKAPEPVMTEPAGPEEVVEAEETPAPKVEPPQAAAKEYFECPECGTMIETTATACPKCGVLFAEEGAEMFQCPACSTLVSMDAKSCPGCGAMFIEPDEAEAAQPEAKPAEVKVEFEPPLAEVKPAAVSTRALKEPKAAPAPSPKEKKVEAETKDRKGPLGWLRRKKKDEKEETEEEEAEVEEERKPAKAPAIPGLAHEPSPEPAPEAPPAPKPVVEEIPVKKPEPIRPEAPAPDVKDKGRDIARMFAEMKPMLSLALENDVDIAESKQLIEDAAAVARERQLDKAIELVQKSRELLLAKVDANISETLLQLKDELQIASELGGDVSRPTTYFQEIEKAKSSGDVEAAYVYADKVKKELLPITGRYNESKKKVSSLKALISDSETFIVDTKEARNMLIEASKAFESRDFDRVDFTVRNAEEKLFKAIPARMNEEMKKAKEQLVEAKVKNVNISPMITLLKSATSLMKSGEYGQAMKEMREFREMVKKIL
jgi:cellobiose-specific phosphotransferase system component IIA/RNA polymerase subunit RPABC4/transcription elongation factor Spt4